MGWSIPMQPRDQPSSDTWERQSSRRVTAMASDSESTSQGVSPMPELSEVPPRDTSKMATGEMLSPTATRRRTPVKGGFPGIIKRAMSSPNVRDLANLDTSELSNAEKKRNKLGYHRTAVACVHCRRRKIRCIIAPDDPTTRCHNCIRLKKDCQFYPVDQQLVPGKRTRSSSKNGDFMHGSPTPEPSPAMAGTPWEQSETFVPGQFQSSAVPSESPSNFSFNGPTLQSENPGLSPASYSTSNLYPSSPWSSTPVLTSPSHTIEPGDFDASSSTHWQPRAHPGLSGYEFTPYPSPGNPAAAQSAIQGGFPAFSQAQAGEPPGWSHLPHHPVRSMSLASPQDLQNYQSTYQNDPRMILQHNSSNTVDLRPVPLSRNTYPAPPTSDTLSSHSAYAYSDHAQMNVSYHSMTPMQNPSMPSPASDAFGHGFFGAPMVLADVREEDEMANMHHQAMSSRFRPHPG